MKYLAIALCLVCANAPAAGPLIGFEYESERNESSGITNHAVDIVPGWEFSDERFINRIELLIDKNQDNKADADGLLAKENKLFIRIRHDGDLTDALGYYIRGGIGRSFNNQRNFNFAYVEPGVEYKFTNDWAWTLAIREGNAIDGAPGHRLTQLRTGPSLDLGKNAEFELIYAKGRGDSNLTSWIFEYVYKF